MRKNFHWKIIIAMLIGIGCGLIIKNIIILPINNQDSYPITLQIIKILGTSFISLLKMITVPLVFFSIITGVSSIDNPNNLSRYGLKTFLYYISTSLTAIFIGLTLTNMIKPGLGVGYNQVASKQIEPNSLLDIFNRIIPTNPFQALASGQMLSIIFFSIFLGIAMNRIQNDYSSSLKHFFSSCFAVIMKMTEYVMSFAPLGIFGLITFQVATADYSVFLKVGLYMLTVFLGLMIHLCIALPLIFYLFTQINPIHHFKAMSTALLTAFSTSSSNATMPVTMRCLEKNVGISNKIRSFVIPLGATINMDGTALYECAGVLFIAQVIGYPIGVPEQLIIIITALLASIGAAGVPSAGLVMIFIVTDAVGLNDPAVPLIIGTMLAVDRPLDMLRTMVNIFSDSIGSVIIAKSENEKVYQDI